MIKEPLISIIIPVYNMERYLSECLNSLIAQTYKCIEILCIDDGSTDNSLTILKEYSAKDSRVIVISQQNQGPLIARSNGLKEMHGKYFFFIDADDYLETNALETLYSRMEADGTNIAFSNFIHNGKMNFKFKKSILTVDEVLTDVLDGQAWMFPCWGMLINKCQIDNEYTGYHLCEDELYALDLFIDTDKVSFVDTPLIFYRHFSSHRPNKGNDYYYQGYQAANQFYEIISTDRPHLKEHAKTRLLMHTFFCYLSCDTKKLTSEQVKLMTTTVKTTRKSVLANKNAFFKIKLAALLSYAGMWLPSIAFKLYAKITG